MIPKYKKRRHKFDKYFRFVKAVLAAVTKARVRLYRSKYSKKLYSQHILLVLLALQQYENKSFRRFVEWLYASTIPAFLSLKRIPHFTTLQKALFRLPIRIIEGVVQTFILLTRKKVLDVGVDSTGYSPTRASSYYNKRVKKRKKRVKKHLKATIAIETRTQLITASKTRRGPASDHKDFKPVLDRTTRKKRLRRVVADKGYDSEENHEYVRYDLNAESIIPCRDTSKLSKKVRGKYRRKMHKRLPEKKYHQRSKNETVNSVEKRLMGDGARNRHVQQQNKELAFKHMAYNAHRLADIIQCLLKGFLQSLFFWFLAVFCEK